MKGTLQTSLTLPLMLVSLSYSNSLAYQKGTKHVQPGTVTGTYKYVLNSLEVLELPDHRVRISFAGYWPNDRRRRESRNVGTFDETVPLKGHTAVVKPKYSGENCAITFEFRANKAIVSEEGYSCGFGFNVEADGTYIKVSSKPPHLPAVEPGQDQQNLSRGCQ